MSSHNKLPQRAVVQRSLPPEVFAWGFSFRKRAIVRRFVGAVKVHFIRRLSALPADSALLLWGSHPIPDGLAPGIRVIRMEDGFLRSVGLGADLIRPLSWVIDHSGIYYDASAPSDLESLLQNTTFSSVMLQRAARLRQKIVESRITKYNVGAGGWTCPAPLTRIILVPGQVESDASIQFGAPGLRTNMDLLQAVRKANPEAYVVYKPHPDVVAGLRARGQREEQALEWCNEVLTAIDMSQLLALVDEVHVLTSLTGFEALLRGKRVVCYGQPFYAGWGLTDDILPLPRRTRQLTLDGLVAGTLMLYPSYVSRHSEGRYITAEQALDELLDWRAGLAAANGFWQRAWRALKAAPLRLALRVWGQGR